MSKNEVTIVLSDKEEGPIKIALNALLRDFGSVMNFEPKVLDKMSDEIDATEIVIVNRESGLLSVPADKVLELDGFESHRVYADPENNRIYVEGFDLRGTIFAIYTFSEKILGVPPLHYWCSWVAGNKGGISSLTGDLNFYFKSPQVRYRSILPGDQDFFNPWKKQSPENDNVWLETTLRLKLNTVETYSTILPGYKLTDYAYLIDKYGLVITSHHTSGLNTSFGTWEEYWEKVRKTEAPKLLLANESAIEEFFRYNAETVVRSGIENLWTVAFRGELTSHSGVSLKMPRQVIKKGLK
ncbi:MAG: glycosyl hydrolase 115 family protein [Marinilabiliales bacterium]|nr:glycosyl hydrolase 115 family protein [Marinilabiliales bacterium]